MTALRTVWLIALDRLARSLRRPAIAATVFLLAGLSTISSTLAARSYQERVEQHKRLAASLLRSQVSAPSFFGGIEPSLRALRPPPVGMIVTRGEDALTSVTADFSDAGAIYSDAPDDPVRNTSVGSLIDLEFVLRVLLGLFAIVAGAESVSRLRANGWMRAMLTLGTRPWQLLLGVWAAGVVLGTAALAACVLIGVASAAGVAEQLDRGVLLMVLRAAPLWTLYVGTMTAVGVGVAAFGRRTASVYGAILAIWVGAAWLGPQLIVAGLRAVRPIDARSTMEANRAREYKTIVDEAQAQAARLYEQFIWENPIKPSDRNLPFEPVIRAAWEPHVPDARAKASAIEQAWFAQDERTRAAASALAYLVPGASLARGVADAADVGGVAVRAWTNAVETMQQQYEARIFDDRAAFTLHVRFTPDASPAIVAVRRHPAPRLGDVPLFQPRDVQSSERRKALVGAALPLFINLAVLLAALSRVSIERLAAPPQ